MYTCEPILYINAYVMQAIIISYKNALIEYIKIRTFNSFLTFTVGLINYADLNSFTLNNLMIY